MTDRPSGPDAPGRAWQEGVRRELERRRSAHLLRSRRVVRALDAAHVEIAGRRLVNFASNDYLGLTHHPAVVAAARRSIERDGLGAGAAPLITGYTPAHASAERAIATWKKTESAVLLPSGYQANLAAVQALAGAGAPGSSALRRPGQRAGVRFLLDKLCHASLVDAVTSRGEFRIFAHNDLGKLRRLLSDAPSGQLQVVVTESIFSMDGDRADLAGMAVLKREFSFVLLLDEAHASGVYGPAGAGLPAEMGLQSLADVTVVTFSKALGGAGAAVCADAGFCEWLVNSARAYLYSTSPPASTAAAAEAAIGVMEAEPGRQARVRELARIMRAELTRRGLSIPTGDSPIVPIVLESEESALRAGRELEERGFLVLPIRPPTVAPGTSRLRVTLCCEHAHDEVDGLLDALVGAIGRR